MKPKKLVKSCELSSLDGVRELSFGQSKADSRMGGSSAKRPKEFKVREFSDITARNKRYGL